MKIALVCSHGGHLTETLQLLPAFTDHEIFFVTYRSTRDTEVGQLARAYFTENIGLDWMRMLRSFIWAWEVLRLERPDVVLSLGAEIALPFFVVARFRKIKTIFIESWCRVVSLSLTGRLVYYLADEFWVQWPQLAARSGRKAEYHGAVI